MAEVPLKGLELWACRWKDAHYNSNEFERHEITHRPILYVTTGILLKDDETGVAIATDVCETNTFRGINAIPRELVLETWRVGALQRRGGRRTAPSANQNLQAESLTTSSKQ